jgi:hypothetical protein
MGMIVALLRSFLDNRGLTLNTGGAGGAILPARKVGFIAHATGRKELQYWTPTRSDVEKAIPRVEAFLAREAPSLEGRLQNYRCQYFGIVVEGTKRIYCNFFHRDGHHEDWRTKPVFVLDGGDWYFQLEYEVETELCLDFGVNGEA